MENEIVNERVVAYINSLNVENRDIVETIEKEAKIRSSYHKKRS